MPRNSRIKRKPLTKAQLLPLRNTEVRALSLDGHTALAAVRSGHGGVVQIGHLAKAIYVSFFLRDLTPDGMDVEQFHRAEGVIERCIERASKVEAWTLPDADYLVLERMLVLYDTQLEAVPVYRLAQAWNMYQRAVSDSLRRPVDAAVAEQFEFALNAAQGQLK